MADSVVHDAGPLHILFVEDVAEDCAMAERVLRQDGLIFNSLRVDTREAFLDAFDRLRPDAVISDYSMPQFDCMQALQLARAKDPLVPFLVLTGSIDEETAVTCMKAGASDYVTKEQVTRLPYALRGALRHAAAVRAEAIAGAAVQAGQREMAAIYQNAPVIMMLLDREGRVRKANHLAAHVAESPPEHITKLSCCAVLRCADSMVGQSCWGAGPACDSCVVRRMVCDTLATGVSHHQTESVLLARGGESVRRHTYLLSTARLLLHDEPHVLLTMLDISERTRVEEALAVSEKRYRLVSELISAYAYSFRIEPDGSLSREWVTAEAMQRITGYTSDELTALGSWMHLLHPEDIPVAVKRFERLLREESDTSEFRILRKDGELRWLADFGKPIWDEREQRYTHILGAARDITRQKRVEEALRASEVKYRELFEQSLDAINTNTPEGELLDYNQAWLNLLGYEREDMHGFNVINVYADPADREDFLRRIVEQGSVVDEVRFKRKDGRIITCQRSVTSRRDASGCIISLQGINRDITAQKDAEVALRASEERFRGVFQTSQVGIAIVDTKTQGFIDANPSFLRLLGYSLTELRSLTVAGVTHPDDWHGEQRMIEAYRAGELVTYEVEKRYVRKDGTVRHVIVAGEPLRLDGREFPLSVASVLDITDRKRAEEELSRSRQELRLLASRIEQVRENERAGIARELHDQVGQALTALKMDIDRLGSMVDEQDSTKRTMLRDMAALVLRTGDDVRRISSDLRPGILDDFGLVSAIEWQLSSFQEHSGIRCDLVADIDESLVDRARSTALFRVFQELLTNVSRHAEATEVEVTVYLADGELTLSVADNGRGVSHTKLESRTALGIIGMRERLLPFNGTLTYESLRPSGTVAMVVMPLPAP